VGKSCEKNGGSGEWGRKKKRGQAGDLFITQQGELKTTTSSTKIYGTHIHNNRAICKSTSGDILISTLNSDQEGIKNFHCSVYVCKKLRDCCRQNEFI
jgi:hypothetical protein